MYQLSYQMAMKTLKMSEGDREQYVFRRTKLNTKICTAKRVKREVGGTGNNFTWPFMVNGSQEISVFHVVSILEDDQVVYSLMHFHMYIMFTFENSWS